MTRIAFLGLGRMGAPMAGRLSDAGHELTVWSRTAAHAQALAGKAAVASSPAAAARDAEVAITMLADGSVVEAVVLGPDGVASALPEGGLVIDMSTTGPATSKRLEAALGERGLAFVDAPVAGSTVPATEGTLAVYVGGSPGAIDRAAPLLRVLGDPGRTWRLGPAGSGQAAKLAVNLVLGAVTSAVAEGFTLALALGLEADAALDLLERTSAAGQTFARKRDRLLSGRFDDPSFGLALMSKDLRLAREAAAAAGARVPVTDCVARLYAAAEQAGLGDADYTAVVSYLQPSDG